MIPAFPTIPNLSSTAVSGNGDSIFDASGTFGGLTINEGLSPLLVVGLVAGVAGILFVALKK